jgi:hypothetical protein
MVQTNTVAPKYCGQCGTPLRTSSRALGFDVFTGQPVEESSLYCSATVVERGRFRLREVPANHAVWEANQNGIWEQVIG